MVISRIISDLKAIIRKHSSVKIAAANVTQLATKIADYIVSLTPPEPVKGDGDRIIKIMPVNNDRSLNIGKGVSAMTPSESARADEQLNRSPYKSESHGNA